MRAAYLTHVFILFQMASALSTAWAQAGFSYQTVESTPYDTQMVRVEKFLRTHADHPGDDIPTLEQVSRWMQQLKAVPYQYTSTWKTPAELQATRSGDCKAKALSLYFLMRAYGAKNVILVIGRKSNASSGTHAWLVWKHQGKVYLLDPSSHATAIEVPPLGSGRYIPHYGYSDGRKLRPIAS